MKFSGVDDRSSGGVIPPSPRSSISISKYHLLDEIFTCFLNRHFASSEIQHWPPERATPVISEYSLPLSPRLCSRPPVALLLEPSYLPFVSLFDNYESH